ncbi:MAG TPA: sulfotransferase [Caulobacteraceae bacterium]|nr:sulfotransferase [Caulobacteraceae bacterium]
MSRLYSTPGTPLAAPGPRAAFEAAISSGYAARRAGRLNDALVAAEQAVKAAPARPEGWFLYGSTLSELNRYQEAVSALERSADLTPSPPAARAHVLAEKARALVGAWRWAEAAEAARQSIALGPTDPEVNNLLGLVLTRIKRLEPALDRLEAAVAAKPDRADFWMNCGLARFYMGRIEAAEAAFEQAIHRAPNMAPAYLALSKLKRWTAVSNHVDRIRSARGAASAPIDRARLGYALFKELDDLGRKEEAWTALEHSASAVASLRPWSTEREQRLVERLESAFPPAMFKPAPPRQGGPRPIFIVGLPRSGTTLIERILAAHSRVSAMGELQTFRVIMKGDGVDEADLISPEALDREFRWAKVAQTYWKETAFLAGRSPQVIDKLPQNHLFCGPIRLAFPEAAIIHVRRDPMDSLFGAYKVLFGRAYPWSYSFQGLHDHFLAYRRLMDHWRACLGDGLIEVSYEALTANPEAEIRRLLDRCGLPFEEACLSPHETEGAVTTSSASQVREPISRKSVGGWRRYAAQLEPLRLMLERSGIVDANGDPLER